MLGIIAIQLFWLSFLPIGLALALVLRRISLPHEFWMRLYRALAVQHSVVVGFVLLLQGFILFLPLLVLAYIFELPVLLVTAFYIACLLASVVVLWQEYSMVRRYVKGRWANLNRSQVRLGCIIVGGLLIEFIIGLYIGGNIRDDVPVHLSKIQMFLNTGHFSLTDPFMGYNGIIDIRYSTNLLNGLQTVAAQLFHVSAYTVWFYSYAFYSLLLASSMFVLARVFLPKKIPTNWLYVILLMLPYYDQTYFFKYAELPHSIVLAWTALLFIGLKFLLEKKSSVIFWLAILLTASTHTLSSFCALLFLILLAIVLAAFRKIDKRQLAVLLAGMLVLAIPVAVNAAMPSRSTGPDLVVEQGIGLHSRPLGVSHHGRAVLPKLPPAPHDSFLISPLVDYKVLLIYAILGLYAWLLKKLDRPLVKTILFWLMVLVALEAYRSLYFSFIGYVYTVYNLKDLRVKILVTLAVLFYALTAYNPLFLSLAVGTLPLWMIARFQDFNTFAFIAPLLGAFILFRKFAAVWKIDRQANVYLLVILMAVIAIPSYYRVPIGVRSFVKLDKEVRLVNSEDKQTVAALKQIDPYVRGSVLLTNDTAVESDMALASSGTIGLLTNIQSNQSEDLYRRQACSDQLLDHLQLSDLQAAHIDRLVLSTYPPNKRGNQELTKTLQLANDKPYLHFLKQVQTYRVYTVDAPSKAVSHTGVCAIPYKN